jgi:hypothetical protein
MRIEQLIGNYTSLSGQKRSWKEPKTGFPKKPFLGRASVLDIVCLTVDETDEDLDWLETYIRQLPVDMVNEKIKQLFSTSQSSDDSLIEKLLFELI